LLLGYVGFSTICFYFPSLMDSLLHRRPPTAVNSRLSVAYGAHRGGGGERVENTISAFDHAVECGMGLLELDVRLTRDKKVIVYHDSTTERTTGVRRIISETDYEDLPLSLQSLPAPPPFNSPDKMMISKPSTTDPTSPIWSDWYRIPTLQSVLHRYPNSVLNIDLKDDSAELVDLVADLIESEGAEDRVIWGSMFSSVNRLQMKRSQSIPRFFSPQQLLILYFQYLTGILPFCPLPAAYLEIPYLTERMKPIYSRLIRERVGDFAVRPLMSLLIWLSRSSHLFNHLRSRGVFVIVWVINEEVEFIETRQLLRQRGITGIMTDFPSKLSQEIHQ